jgi:hypothetical protein
MCRLYTCQACAKGDHERCGRGYGDGKSFGGGQCVCRCAGRSEKAWRAAEEREWEAHKRRLFRWMDASERRARRPGPLIGSGEGRTAYVGING